MSVETTGFKFFGPVAQKPGFAAGLAQTLRELRASGVEPSQLEALGDRGQDMAALLTDYRQQLQTAKLADITEVFAIARTEVLAGNAFLSKHFLPFRRVTIGLFSRF